MSASDSAESATGSLLDIIVSTPAARILLIRINRPHVRNALRTRTLGEIAAVLSAADQDVGILAAVITGSEDIFAAGADIRELAALDTAAALADLRPAHWKAIRSFSKPLIAAVHGYALGAGCEMVLLADMVVAATGAQFGQPEINLGIIPAAGGIQRLTRAVGKPLAMKMVLTGALLDAQAALWACMVTEVVAPEECLPRAIAHAETIATKAPLAIKAAKRMINHVYETGLEQGLGDERQAFCHLMDSLDKREGVAAFLEKRKPIFEGR